MKDEMNHCDKCKHWKAVSGMTYDIVVPSAGLPLLSRRCRHPKLDRQPEAEHGFFTGPEFGCVHHENKEVVSER